MPSVSGAEQPLADLIAGALAGLPHLTVHRDGNALVARTELGRAERVAIAGHIDTVPRGGQPAIPAGARPRRDRPGPVRPGQLRHEVGGVAVALRLAAGLPEPSRDVTYVFYDCEEVEAERNGLLRLSRNRPDLLAADFAVLMEPTGGLVEGGCQGTMRAEIARPGSGRTAPAAGWAATPSTTPARSWTCCAATEPRQPEVDGLQLPRGPERRRDQRRRGRQRDP